MKFSLECICGYETPRVEIRSQVDWDMMHIHQQWCEQYRFYNAEKAELKEVMEE